MYTTGHIHNAQKSGRNRESTIHHHQQKSLQNLTQGTGFVFTVCCCVPATIHTICGSHTHTPSTCHSHSYTFPANTHVHMSKKTNKHREAPTSKHGKERQKSPAKIHTIARRVHTAYMKSSANACIPLNSHTHTTLSACEKLQGDGCLFVCLRRCFWCVCDTTRPRSPPLRPLYSPGGDEM